MELRILGRIADRMVIRIVDRMVIRIAAHTLGRIVIRMVIRTVDRIEDIGCEPQPCSTAPDPHPAAIQTD